MARKNRVTVPDGIYHITSRICNKAILFKPDYVKEKIMKWIFDIAYFSGVEIYAWCIMDNHLHLLVHVPRVPERLWLNPAQEPASWAFGMRPPECFPPLWTGDLESSVDWHDGKDPQVSSFDFDGCKDRGGAPYEERRRDVFAEPVCQWRKLPRPAVGFMLDDEEMIARLAALYSPKVADEIGARWRDLRSRNRADEVDEEKNRYCRRMYNISQFVKTLKERIAMRYNAEYKHEGCLWQGRFYSGIVENSAEVLSVVAGYIDYNPVKAKLVKSPESWKFSSWAVALGTGDEAEQCRKMYCKMLGCEWQDAKSIMLSVLNDKLPDGVSAEDVKAYYDKYDENAELPEDNSDSDNLSSLKGKLRASQAIRCDMWFFKKGGYIGRTLDFAFKSVRHLPIGYPRTGFLSIKRCRAFEWVRTIDTGNRGALAA